MNPDIFAKLATQNFNRIPITREVLADLETPLSVYLKLAFGPNSYLFESVQGGEKWGRYSLIGMQTSTVLKLYGNRLEIIRDGKPMVTRNTMIHWERLSDLELSLACQTYQIYLDLPVDSWAILVTTRFVMLSLGYLKVHLRINWALLTYY